MFTYTPLGQSERATILVSYSIMVNRRYTKIKGYTFSIKNSIRASPYKTLLSSNPRVSCVHENSRSAWIEYKAICCLKYDCRFKNQHRKSTEFRIKDSYCVILSFQQVMMAPRIIYLLLLKKRSHPCMLLPENTVIASDMILLRYVQNRKMEALLIPPFYPSFRWHHKSLHN